MSLVIISEPIPQVKVVKLNRPEKLNALSLDLISELSSQLTAIYQEALEYKVRVVLLSSSTTKAFCAGADLVERSNMTTDQVSETLLSLRKLMDTLASIPCPTLACIQGMAFGGGLELALACDLRIANEDAKMGLSEVKLGIIPGAGGTQRLTRLLGAAKAKELILMARTVTGLEAKIIGLVNEVSTDVEKLAMTWAQEILNLGPIAVNSAKLAVDSGQDLPLKDGLDWERRCYDNTLHSQDRIEGLKAFLEKRKPQYCAK